MKRLLSISYFSPAALRHDLTDRLANIIRDIKDDFDADLMHAVVETKQIHEGKKVYIAPYYHAFKKYQDQWYEVNKANLQIQIERGDIVPFERTESTETGPVIGWASLGSLGASRSGSAMSRSNNSVVGDMMKHPPYIEEEQFDIRHEKEAAMYEELEEKQNIWNNQFRKVSKLIESYLSTNLEAAKIIARRLAFKRWISKGLLPIYIRIMALEKNMLDDASLPRRLAKSFGISRWGLVHSEVRIIDMAYSFNTSNNVRTYLMNRQNRKMQKNEQNENRFTPIEIRIFDLAPKDEWIDAIANLIVEFDETDIDILAEKITRQMLDEYKPKLPKFDKFCSLVVETEFRPYSIAEFNCQHFTQRAADALLRELESMKIFPQKDFTSLTQTFYPYYRTTIMNSSFGILLDETQHSYTTDEWLSRHLRTDLTHNRIKPNMYGDKAEEFLGQMHDLKLFPNVMRILTDLQFPNEIWQGRKQSWVTVQRFQTIDETAIVITTKGQIITVVSPTESRDTPNDELPLDYLGTAARFFISSSEEEMEEGEIPSQQQEHALQHLQLVYHEIMYNYYTNAIMAANILRTKHRFGFLNCYEIN